LFDPQGVFWEAFIGSKVRIICKPQAVWSVMHFLTTTVATGVHPFPSYAR